ncbi:hypothetical protein GCM10009745_36850 [Kribbella yunnanensis]|uniref:Uncharacterized protein n=1 Tax=Kribbella yunnanensis TaxID=190194 RepID=A0ABP4TI72_9ACTN
MNDTPAGDDQASRRADLTRRGRLIPATDPAPIKLAPGEVSPDDSTEHVSALREERL